MKKRIIATYMRLRHAQCPVQTPINGMCRCMKHPWVTWRVDMPVSKELAAKLEEHHGRNLQQPAAV